MPLNKSYRFFLLIVLFLVIGLASVLKAEDTLLVYNKVYAGTVNKLISLPAKNILITGGGVIEYNPENDSIIKWYKPVNSMLAGTNIIDYAYDPDSALWVCDYDNGIFKLDENDPVFYNRKNSPLGSYGISGILSVEFDDDGNLWVGTNGGLFIRWVDRGWELFNNDYLETVLDIAKDSAGVMHLASLDWLVKYDHGNWSYLNFEEMTGISYEIARQVFIAGNGDIYYKGYSCFVKVAGNTTRIIKLSDYDSTFYDYSNGITENNNGDIYLSGIDGYVVLKHDGSVSVIREDSIGIQFNQVINLLHDSYRNKVYLGLYEKGLVDISSESLDTLCIGCNELPYKNIKFALFNHNNKLWTLGNDIASFENGKWKYFYHYNSYNARSFVVTGDDEMLFNTFEQVMIYSNGEWKISQVSVWTGNGGLFEMVLGKNNYTYISTKIGLCYRKPFSNFWYKMGSAKDYLNTYHICSDTSGKIWLTHDEGIGYFNPEDNQFTYYYTSNIPIPAGEYYHGIKCDRLNRLWLNVDTSIYLGSVEDLNTWKCFIQNTGNGRLKDVYVDKYGKTWLLTSDQLWIMNETDTVIYGKDDGIFANSGCFNNATVDTNGIYWISGCGGMTGLKYTVTGGVFNKPGRNHSRVKVYPNPVSNNVFFEIKSLSNRQNTITVYNLYGQIVKKTNFYGNKCSLDLSSSPSGIYIYHLNNRLAGKLILK